MDLVCTESMTASNFAQADPNIFNDERVIENLLREEMLYVPECNYFEQVQEDIEPFMRKVVTTWMLEVCISNDGYIERRSVRKELSLCEYLRFGTLTLQVAVLDFCRDSKLQFLHLV